MIPLKLRQYMCRVDGDAYYRYMLQVRYIDDVTLDAPLSISVLDLQKVTAGNLRTYISLNRKPTLLLL